MHNDKDYTQLITIDYADLNSNWTETGNGLTNKLTN